MTKWLVCSGVFKLLLLKILLLQSIHLFSQTSDTKLFRFKTIKVILTR